MLLVYVISSPRLPNLVRFASSPLTASSLRLVVATITTFFVASPFKFIILFYICLYCIIAPSHRILSSSLALSIVRQVYMISPFPRLNGSSRSCFMMLLCLCYSCIIRCVVFIIFLCYYLFCLHLIVYSLYSRVHLVIVL